MEGRSVTPRRHDDKAADHSGAQIIASIRYNPAMPRPLPRSFYARPTLTVARDLLGSVLARRHPETGAILKGVIVESEAYVGEADKACHARAGRTPRTSVMYGRPGHAYVYLTYGMHYMLNVVTEAEESPAAVLIRAVEPLEGLEDMRRARGLDQLHLLTSARGSSAKPSPSISTRTGRTFSVRNSGSSRGDPSRKQRWPPPPGSAARQPRLPGTAFHGVFMSRSRAS